MWERYHIYDYHRHRRILLVPFEENPSLAKTLLAAVGPPPGALQKIADGLIEVCKVVGIIDGEPNQSPAPTFMRKVAFSDHAGIWRPTAQLMSQVRVNEKIGELTALDLFKSTNVLAPVNGVLIQLRSSDLVATGTSLFAVGIETLEVSYNLGTIRSPSEEN